MFYTDSTMTIGDKLFVAACYVLPIITFIILPVFWFIYPVFVLAVFLSRPKHFITRFHLIQSLLCFLAFVIFITITLVLVSTNSHNLALLRTADIVTSIVTYLYFVLVLLMIFLLFIGRYFKIPAFRVLAEKYANRNRAPEKSLDPAEQ